MRERDQIRLLEYLDDRLSANERSEVEAWLAVDAEARRLVDEHRLVWDALGTLEGVHDPQLAAPSGSFRERVQQSAGGLTTTEPFSRGLQATGLLAAAVVLAVAVFQWYAPSQGTADLLLSDEERMVVQDLDLLENLELLEQYGVELDLARELEVMRAFDGEGEIAALGSEADAGGEPGR